ncbi:MAG TPA: hypothetical protein V6D18_13310 [Thermosynechococcaceae cyanobacterium]
MSIDAALEHVINRTALIENILNQVIQAHLQPRNEAFQFFWDVLMDSSILPLGSKVKVAMAISQESGFKLDQTVLHTVISLRNAFAHHDTKAHPEFIVGKTSDADQFRYTLQVISNSGRITRKGRAEALAEFDEAYAKAKESLKALLTAISASNAEDSPSN